MASPAAEATLVVARKPPAPCPVHPSPRPLGPAQ